MKKYFILAASALALAGCSSDEYLGQTPGNEQGKSSVIKFGGETGKLTRVSSNATNSYKLENLRANGFWVYGIKYAADEAAASGTNDKVVYKNYRVTWTNNSANTTQSNTAGWEYVGVENSEYREHVTPYVSTNQEMKYWDYSAKGYTFYAATAKPDDVKAGKVVFKKIESDGTEGTTVYDKGYEVTLKDDADIDNLYFADRKPIAHSSDAEHGKDDKFGGEVNFTFRNALAKVRVGMYETIPGYSVKIDKFYYTDDANTSKEGTDKFYADAQNTLLETSGDNGVKYKVVYYNQTESDGQLVNQPKMLPNESGQGSTKQYLAIGDGENLKKDTILATEVLKPTYDQKDGKYTFFLPQAANDKPLKLKLDYTLTSDDKSGEEIKVTGATATIPAKYLCWRPNYAYTYLFKISTNTNGMTGGTGDPAGLYPISFDAAVEVTATGNTEYITSLSKTSITTFAVNNGEYEFGKDDYTLASDIYVTVTDESGSVKEDVAEKCVLYKLNDTYADKATEAQVAQWVANNQNVFVTKWGCKGLNVTSVPSEDGKTIAINALKLSSIIHNTDEDAKGGTGTYAIEYTASDKWTGEYTKVYKIIKVVKN